MSCPVHSSNREMNAYALVGQTTCFTRKKKSETATLAKVKIHFPTT